MYQSNPEFSLALKNTPALAFEKIEEVDSALRLVIKKIKKYTISCPSTSVRHEVEKIEELCSYFQNINI